MASSIKRMRVRSPASGRFVLRLPVELHAALRTAADAENLSLNEYCCRKLAWPGAIANHADGAAAVVARANELFGHRLLAVVAYGSWARGEAQRDSDVDVLVVLDERSPITRELYREWDAHGLMVDGHAVEPHFVRLRSAEDPLTGLWAEAALDGIMLYERGLEVSRSLACVRRELISGRLTRKTAHGQPYWTEVA
jgi:predicted nucleotidyltransferase